MTDETLPVPVSYTLRFAKGSVHPIAVAALATTYQARQVTRLKSHLRLQNFVIRCNHKRDGEPGNEAEIYGAIRVWKRDGAGSNVYEEHMIWGADHHHWTSMQAGQTLPVGTYVDLAYEDYQTVYASGGGFRVEGHFWDQNTFGSDTELPRATKDVPLSDAYTADGGNLSADSYCMSVDFQVTPID